MKRNVEENEVLKILEGHENISKIIKQNDIKRTIFVKNKLINFVLKLDEKNIYNNFYFSICNQLWLSKIVNDRLNNFQIKTFLLVATLKLQTKLKII